MIFPKFKKNPAFFQKFEPKSKLMDHQNIQEENLELSQKKIFQCIPNKIKFFWPKKTSQKKRQPRNLNKFQIQEVKLTVKFISLCSKAKGRAAQATYVAT